MKSFAFALLAAAVVAADVNPTTTGPTVAGIASSSVTITPAIATKVLTVVMDLKWTMTAVLASGNVTEMAACW